MAVRKKADGGNGSPVVLKDFRIDPLLLGADRAFVETFPRQAVLDSGALPLRRYGMLGLVVVRSERDAGESLARLQRESDVRLMAALPLNEYGVELFLRYWDTAKDASKKAHTPTPPIWMPDERRAYLKRLGELASFRGRAHPVAILTSLILTSPLNNQCPVLVVNTGKEGQVLFLGGAGGLRTAVRFPPSLHADLLARLKLEFGMNGVTEARGGDERGLNDLEALLLPPMAAETLILEPRGKK